MPGSIIVIFGVQENEGNKNMKQTLDLSRKACHVCGCRLEKDHIRELEWCNNMHCLLFKFKFNIPYKTPKKLVASAKAVTK